MILDMLTPEEVTEIIRTLDGDRVIQAAAKYSGALAKAKSYLTAALTETPTFFTGIAVGLAIADALIERKIEATWGLNGVRRY